MPALAGRYVFGDYGSADGGKLFALTEADVIEQLGVVGDAAFKRRLLGFGRDLAGEIYVLANDTGTPFGASGVVLRIDAGPGTVSFAVRDDAVSVTESAGSVTVSVVRSGGGDGAATVDFGVGGGSAVEGSDYAPVSGTFRWADGEEGAKSFTIDLVRDSVTEPDETIELVLTNATGAGIGSPATHTVSVADGDSAGDGDSGGGAVGAVFALLLGAALLLHRRRASPSER